MKKISNYLFILLVGLFSATLKVDAATNSLYINLENFEYKVNQNEYTNIKEYESLDDFLIDYNSNSLPEIYITNFLFDGVSSVMSPDLDDYIENDSNDTKVKTLEIRVLNINTIGNVELTGETKGTMIAINTNNVKGNINLILNNVNLDTDSKKTPAIYVYNKETTYTDCIVTIKAKKDSNNYIEGGKLKKVSLVASDELDKYASYYSGDSLTNYQKYTSYYGVYNSNELNNVLFATVKADSEDLQDGDPYIFYKGSGAISSDIDLYFEGEGYLKVTSKNGEGIETKGNLTFSGGTGDYEIYSYDDCLNTTTASNVVTNARNAMIIDVNSLIATVSDDGDEGDAIDSNGTLNINGGTIYAFAHSNSQDAGIDSANGTYINAGTIISTGNMADMISNKSKQKLIYVNFESKIEKDTLIVIKNQDDDIITAFKTSKTISTLLYCSDNLSYESFKIYVGGEIDGEQENGLYSKVNNYSNGEEISYSEISSSNNSIITNKKSNVLLKALLIEIGLLTILLIYVVVDKKLKLKKGI